MQQDFLLIRKMQNGDEDAMEIFVQKYYPQILQYCIYHCPDKEWAQDVTQETFEHFFRSLAKYKNSGKTLNYLYTIAKNLCIDWIRKYGSGRMAGSDKMDREGNGADVENIADEKVDMAESVSEKAVIEDALARLPDELREVVILHYFQECTMREAADILQISVPLVKYRIKKAKVRLRELLEQ